MQVTLKVVEGPHEGRVFRFAEHDAFIVGRAEEAHFQLADKDRYLSRVHFLVEVNPPYCRLLDLGSRNGTKVNGRKVDMIDLKDRDEIRIGRTTLTVAVEQPSDAAATPASEQPARTRPRKAAKPPAAPVTTPPAPVVRAGTLVNLTDPGVVAPVVERAPTPQYPPIALRQRVEGTVELNVLVDENGGVADAQVIEGSGGKVGLNEAAIENVRRRRYRPATKEGVPVKVWIPVRIRFTLPR